MCRRLITKARRKVLGHERPRREDLGPSPHSPARRRRGSTGRLAGRRSIGCGILRPRARVVRPPDWWTGCVAVCPGYAADRRFGAAADGPEGSLAAGRRQRRARRPASALPSPERGCRSPTATQHCREHRAPETLSYRGRRPALAEAASWVQSKRRRECVAERDPCPSPRRNAGGLLPDAR